MTESSPVKMRTAFLLQQKMKIKILLPAVLIFFFIECRNVYRNFSEIPSLKWYKKDVLKFKVNINEDGIYDLFFALRYTTGFPYRNISVKITRKADDGIEWYKDCNFRIVNENDEYIGEVAGDMWDFEECFAEKQEMKHGTYYFEIEHTMPDDPVIPVLDVGLTVRKSQE